MYTSLYWSMKLNLVFTACTVCYHLRTLWHPCQTKWVIKIMKIGRFNPSNIDVVVVGVYRTLKKEMSLLNMSTPQRSTPHQALTSCSYLKSFREPNAGEWNMSDLYFQLEIFLSTFNFQLFNNSLHSFISGESSIIKSS